MHNNIVPRSNYIEQAKIPQLVADKKGTLEWLNQWKALVYRPYEKRECERK